MDTSISTIRQDMAEATARFNAAIEAIAQRINELPDNPKAQRISANIVIIRSSDLMAENWTPEFYNFKAQYQAIVEFVTLDTLTPSQSLERLQYVLDTGSYWRYEGMGNYNTKRNVALHPDVVRNLKQFIQ